MTTPLRMPRRERFHPWFAASGRLPTRWRKGAPTQAGCAPSWTACRPRRRRSPRPAWPRGAGGYSRLAGQTPPAELADRISTLQRWATHEVERRKGIVDKFAGDAVMATFNVSGQSVDHTLQALRAAVAIIDKSGLAGLPVGAGVAVGPAGGGKPAQSANLSRLRGGTNLPSRLQAAAGAGGGVAAAGGFPPV